MKKRFTYSGNENENYSLYDNGKLIAELFMGEDDAIDFVDRLNQYFDIWYPAYSE